MSNGSSRRFFPNWRQFLIALLISPIHLISPLMFNSSYCISSEPLPKQFAFPFLFAETSFETPRLYSSGLLYNTVFWTVIILVILTTVSRSLTKRNTITFSSRIPKVLMLIWAILIVLVSPVYFSLFTTGPYSPTSNWGSLFEPKFTSCDYKIDFYFVAGTPLDWNYWNNNWTRLSPSQSIIIFAFGALSLLAFVYFLKRLNVKEEV